MTEPPDQPSDEERRRARRSFAATLAPVALLLLVLGVIFGDEGGTAGALGTAALAQGIGLSVALIWLAAGHNPLSRR